MGLFDSIAQIAGQALSSQNGQGTLVEGVLGMLSQHEGGLAGLVQAFRHNGLGEIAASWVGTGHNLPVSAEQLQQVLGSGALGDLASKFGISPEQVTGQLSQLLPQVVDKLTPDGELPGRLDLGNALGLLQGLINK